MKKRTKRKTELRCIENLKKPFEVIAKVGRGRYNENRIRVSEGSVPGSLELSASIEESIALNDRDKAKGLVWASWLTVGEGGLSRALEIDPKLFKIIMGDSGGLRINDRGKKWELTDRDEVAAEVPAMASDWVEEAPEASGGTMATPEAHELLEALEGAAIAMDKDGGRPHLSCLHLHKRDCVATDGHRLQYQPLPFDVPEVAMIPAAGVQALIGFLKITAKKAKIVVGADSEIMTFERAGSFARWKVTIRFPKEKFPPWEKVVPPWERAGGTVVSLDGKKLRKALAKCKKVIGKATPCIELNVEEEALKIRAENIDNDITLNLSLPSTFRGAEKMRMGVDVNYLSDAVRSDGTIDLYFGAFKEIPASQRPMGTHKTHENFTGDSLVINAPGSLAFGLVMPMRL
jgi:DNA polymerase III sliding clamp (beta) subunit (PCNA family)